MAAGGARCDRCKETVHEYLSPCPGCHDRVCSRCRSRALANPGATSSLRRCDRCWAGSSTCSICADPFDVENPVARDCKLCKKRTCRSCGVSGRSSLDVEERVCRRCYPPGKLPGVQDTPAGINFAGGVLYWPAFPEPVTKMGPSGETYRAWTAYRMIRGPVSEAAIAALCGALGDNSPAVRTYSAAALGGIGARMPDRRRAIGALVRQERASEWVVRLMALGALAEMDPFEPMALSTLVEALGDRDARVREQAQAALAGLEAVADRALPLLIRCFQLQPSAWLGAARLLLELGPAARDALPALRQAAEQAEDPVRAELLEVAAALDFPPSP